MKTCQTCNRTYDDDTLSFCLYDGSHLVPLSREAQPTQRMPAAPDTEPYATNNPAQGYVAPPPPVMQSPPLQHGGWGAQPPPKKSGRMWLAVAAVAGLLLAGGGVVLGIVLSRGYLFGGDETTNRSNSNEQTAYRGHNNNSTAVTPTPSPAPTPQPTPTPDVPAAEKLGLVGKWSGSQNRRPASLTITGC